MFDSEYEAFKAYATSYPDSTTLLVDTYNTLKSGVPNAIRVGKEVLEPMGKRLKAIRIDSGDLTYLTKEARKQLDDAGMRDCKITVSNALDEYLIADLLRQGAEIDSFGVGERLITSRAEPVFGGVYKLSALELDGVIIPRMKVSDNIGKVTTPCNKEVWRFYDKNSGKALADLITVVGEDVENTKTYEIFDPLHTWKRKKLSRYKVRKLLEPIFVAGKCVYPKKDLEEIRSYAASQMNTLWDTMLRFENPQLYYVDLSQKLWDIKQDLLKKHGMV